MTPRQIHQGTNRVHTNVFSECTVWFEFFLSISTADKFGDRIQMQQLKQGRLNKMHLNRSIFGNLVLIKIAK